MTSSDSCFQNFSCTDRFSSAQCAQVQPNSILHLSEALWNGSCECPDSVVGSLDPESNLTCVNDVISYRYAPVNDQQREICLEGATDVQTGVIGAIVALNFGLPALCLLLILLRRTSAKAHARSNSSSQPQLNPPPASARPVARVTFENVCFRIGEKEILKNVSASLEPAKLTAIMGPSGCGKSTLLDILANRGRGATNNVSGKILVNGLPRGPFWKRISAYVEQFDALFPHLTVREMLTYSAELRSSSPEHVTASVNKVLADLELSHVADTRIGDKFIKGISGGQARRVTVGLELLADPAVLFLDEPTSGLDSTSAKSLVETLKRLTQNSGCTIACTIHQPRSSTFRLFDNLILMKSGEMAYFGPLSGISTYLREFLNVVVPRSVNLADFVVDLTYDKDESETTEELSSSSAINLDVNALTEAWKQKKFVVSADELSSDLLNYVKAHGAYEGSKFARTTVDQVYILVRRSFTNLSRNKGYFVAVALQNLQFLFYGLLFVGLRIYPDGTPMQFTAQSGSDGVAMNIIDLYKKNFLFQVMNTVCIVESVVIASAFLEKNIFLREHAAGSYSSLSYHIQWYIRLTSDAIWKGLVASLLCYFFPPMRITADAFFFFWAVLMVVSTVGSSLAFFMASAVVDAEGAANIHNTIIGFMGTYAGFFLPSILIPIFTLWAYYLSFMKYSFEALEQNEWSDCASYFMSSQFLSLDLTLNRWTNLLVLMAYPIIFHLAAFASSLLKTGELKLPSCKRGSKASNLKAIPKAPEYGVPEKERLQKAPVDIPLMENSLNGDSKTTEAQNPPMNDEGVKMDANESVDAASALQVT